MFSFDIAEYKERVIKTKIRMAAEGIEVLLITDPANMNYLSGYDAWSFYVHQLIVIIIDEEQPIWIGRDLDANGAKITTWLYHENIISYSDDYVQSTRKHPMDFVSGILREIGQGNRTIAVEKDVYYFTAMCGEKLKLGLPNATFKDATNLVNRVRLIKSNQEIDYMQRAGKIVEWTMQMAIESVEAGVRECDVAAKIFHSQISGTEHFGGDYPAIVPLIPAGIKTSTPHLTWSDDRYKDGDSVILEIAGCYKRYHSPLARTVVIGQPSHHVSELSKVVIEGMNAALDFVKPGVTGEEVEAVWRQTIAKSGFEKESRIGYAMGLNYPPDWGEHTVSLRQGDKTILQPNMTFHMIPGIWYDGFGVELSESFRVTESGIELFANVPRELFIKHSNIHTAS